MALPEDPKPKIRVNAFSKLCSRHPLCVQASVFLLEDPYVPGDSRRTPHVLPNGPEAVETLKDLLDRYWIWNAAAAEKREKKQNAQAEEQKTTGGEEGGKSPSGPSGGVGGGTGGGQTAADEHEGTTGVAGATLMSGPGPGGASSEPVLSAEELKRFLYPISKDCRGSVELFRHKALSVKKMEEYMPIIYKAETRARNAFLSHELQDTTKVYHMRWWLFLAVQRMVIDRFTLRQDGSISFCADNFMRMDEEQIHDDNEVSYFRQVVRRCMEEFCGNWKWKNIVNGLISREVQLFADGKFQPASPLHPKSQVDAICNLEQLVRLLMDDLLLPLQLTVAPITQAQYVFEKSFVLDKEALEKKKIRQGAPKSNKARFGAFVSLIVKREKPSLATGLLKKKGGKDGAHGLVELTDDDRSQSPLVHRGSVKASKAEQLERRLMISDQLEPRDVRFREAAGKRSISPARRLELKNEEIERQKNDFKTGNGGAAVASSVRVNERYGTLEIADIITEGGGSAFETGEREEKLNELVKYFDKLSKLTQVAKYSSRDVRELQKIPFPRFEFREFREHPRIDVELYNIAEKALLHSRWGVEFFPVPADLKGWVGASEIVHVRPPRIVKPMAKSLWKTQKQAMQEEILRKKKPSKLSKKGVALVPEEEQQLAVDEKSLAMFFESDYLYSISHKCPKFSLFHYDEPRPKKFVKIDGKAYAVNEETGEISGYMSKEEKARLEKVKQDFNKKVLDLKDRELFDLDRPDDYDGPPSDEMAALLEEMNNALLPRIYKWDFKNELVYDEPPVVIKKKTEVKIEARGDKIVPDDDPAEQGGVGDGVGADVVGEGAGAGGEGASPQEQLEALQAELDSLNAEVERDEAQQAKEAAAGTAASPEKKDRRLQRAAKKAALLARMGKAAAARQREIDALNALLEADKPPEYEDEATLYSFNQVRAGYHNLQHSLHFNRKIHESALLLTAYRTALHLHPLNFVYGSAYFLTASLFANYGSRLRYLNVAYCVDIDTNILRVILLRCPNLMALDVTGLVREGHKRLKEIRDELGIRPRSVAAAIVENGGAAGINGGSVLAAGVRGNEITGGVNRALALGTASSESRPGTAQQGGATVTGVGTTVVGKTSMGADAAGRPIVSSEGSGGDQAAGGVFGSLGPGFGPTPPSSGQMGSSSEDREPNEFEKSLRNRPYHERVAIEKMNSIMEREDEDFERFHDLLPGVPVDALTQLIEQHKFLKVVIANEARLEPDSLLRLLYSATVENKHGLHCCKLARTLDTRKLHANQMFDSDTWDVIIAALDEYVLKRGERCLDRGEFIAYEAGIYWRKQPKPHTTSALVREGYGAEKQPVPVNVDEMKAHVYKIGEELRELRDGAIEKNSKIILDEIHLKMMNVHKLLLHPQIRLLEDFADPPEDEL